MSSRGDRNIKLFSNSLESGSNAEHREAQTAVRQKKKEKIISHANVPLKASEVISFKSNTCL